MYRLDYEGFSHDYVKKQLLRNRKIKFRYDLYNSQGKYLGELDSVNGSIEFDSTSQIMRTAKFDIVESRLNEINRIDDRLRPYFCLYIDRQWIEYPLGVFILFSPLRRKENNQVIRSVEAYDNTIMLSEDRIDNRLCIKKGSLYTNAVSDIVNNSGLIQTNIQTSTLQLPSDMEFEIGTSKIEIVNSLLRAINYTPLYCDSNGTAIAKSYVEPVLREIEDYYITDQDSIIYSGSSQNLDVYSVPNKFVRYLENPDMGELISVYTNSDASSPVSTVNRGRTIVDAQSVSDIANQSTLDGYVRRVAADASQVFEEVIFNSALMPHHEYSDCLYLNNSEINISGKYIEIAWSMDLNVGGKMYHKCRKAVPLF